MLPTIDEWYRKMLIAATSNVIEGLKCINEKVSGEGVCRRGKSTACGRT